MEQAYMTAAEAAKKWGISDRRVRLLCSSGKIEGIVRTGRSYQIPREAVKPADERTLRQKDIPAEYKSLFRRIDGKRDELLRRLREGGFCLEEYLDYLSHFPAEGPHLEITIQNKSFEIFYQKAEASDGSVLLSLPSTLPFQVSGTNTDGCVVTLWR